MTSNLAKHVDEHKSHAVDGFTEKYDIDKLVWREMFDSIEQAIVREKQLKKWNHAWKLALIEKGYPGWNDLAKDII